MLLAICADTDATLGRFNQDTLTDQMRMELLIDGLTDEAKRIFKYYNGDYMDIARWAGVEVDADTNTVHFIFFGVFASGSLALEFMPPTTRKFDLSEGKVSGTIDTAALPDSLTTFTFRTAYTAGGTINFCTLPPRLIDLDLSANKFEGNADLTALPETLESLDIRFNNFTGSVALDKLPQKLIKLRMGENDFEGSVALDALPEALDELDLSNCKLSGSLNLRSLPSSMEYLFVDDNAFSGELCLTVPMMRLRDAHFQNNAFFGVALVDRSICQNVILHDNKITAVKDESGEDYECRMDERGFVDEINF